MGKRSRRGRRSLPVCLPRSAAARATRALSAVKARVAHDTPIGTLDTHARNGHRRWPADAAVVLSIASTGFVTMALSIVWLFAFQNLYGYVYQRIGWIVALFMGGLVIGCGAANRYVAAPNDARAPASPYYARRLWSWLIGVDAAIAALALMIPWLLRTLGGLPAGPWVFALVEVSVSTMVAATGVLGGAAFAVAARLRDAGSDQAGAVAGTIVGADHAGACLGALFCGILLVPVFGTPATAYLLAAVKLSSAALLLAGWKIPNSSRCSLDGGLPIEASSQKTSQ